MRDLKQPMIWFTLASRLCVAPLLITMLPAAPLAGGRPGDKPPGPKKSSAPTVIVEEKKNTKLNLKTSPHPLTDLPPVPESGPLDLPDLINHALQKHPELAKLRGLIDVKAAEAAAAYDWRDPELRFGWATESDLQLDPAWTEQRTGTVTSRRSDTSSIRGREIETNLNFPEFGTSNSTFSETRRESQNTKARYLTERRIIPGRTQDRIVTETYEVENTRSQQTRNRRTGSARLDSNIPNDIAENERRETTNRRKLVSRSEEIRTHPDSLAEDEAFDLQLRLYVPHPWEVKAMAAKARAEMDLNEWKLRREAWDLITAIKQAYEELVFENSLQTYNRELTALSQKQLKDIEAKSREFDKLLNQVQNTLKNQAATAPPATLPNPPATTPAPSEPAVLSIDAGQPSPAPTADTASSAPPPTTPLLPAPGAIQAYFPFNDLNKLFDPTLKMDARLAITKNKIEERDTAREIQEKLNDLARLAGLSDPQRIALKPKLVMRKIDWRTLDRQSLVEAAWTARVELEELNARKKMSQADLDRTMSARIPWPSYLQGGYRRSYTEDRYTGGEWGVQMSLPLPLFSWFLNKEHRVYEAEIAAFENESTTTRDFIRAQVEYALNNLRRAETEVSETTSMLRQHETFSALSREEAKAIEPHRIVAEMNDIEEMSLKLKRDQMQSLSRYNLAVYQLEAALGLDLDRLSSVGQPPKGEDITKAEVEGE